MKYTYLNEVKVIGLLRLLISQYLNLNLVCAILFNCMHAILK